MNLTGFFSDSGKYTTMSGNFSRIRREKIRSEHNSDSKWPMSANRMLSP